MRLIKHSIYNLMGLGLPLVVAIFTIPILIDGLGDAKFGLLTLIWALVSYFSLFDLGLGRALTQQLASILNSPNHEDSGQIVITSLALMAILGVVATLTIYFFGPIGVNNIRNLPDPHEAINSVYIMAASMPFILLTSGFRGILEAKHHFGIINAIRLPMGLLTFLGPTLVVIYIGSNLEIITAILVIGRVLACIAHGWFAWLAISKGHGKFAFNVVLLKPLCFKGGWMTVSNIVSPLMGYVDRFIIGFTISAAAVAFYTTPQEIITKLSIIPGALTAVLFPVFASQLAKENTEIQSIFKFSIGLIFLTLLPISVFVIFFSEEILTIWIDYSFSINSQIYLKIFAIGVLINSISQIPFTLIQSAGLAKTTAKIHLVQFPIYFGMLWALISCYGILGAAFAWLARMIFDSLLMFSACYKIMKWGWGEIFTTVNIGYLSLFTMILIVGFYGSFVLKINILLIVSIYCFYKIIINYDKIYLVKNYNV